MRPLAQQLADYSARTNYQDLGKEIVHEIKRRLLDALGCVYGSFNERPAVLARRVASQLGKGGAIEEHLGAMLSTTSRCSSIAPGNIPPWDISARMNSRKSPWLLNQVSVFT